MVANVSDEEMQEHYDNFFEDVFVECEDKVRLPSPSYFIFVVFKPSDWECFILCTSVTNFSSDLILVFSPCLQYGEIEEMNVCDNLGDHLVGNVYIKVRFLPIFSSSFSVDTVNFYLSCFFLFPCSSAERKMLKKL